MFFRVMGDSMPQGTKDQSMGMMPSEVLASSEKAVSKRSRWLDSHSGHLSTIWEVGLVYVEGFGVEKGRNIPWP